jgi:hypothetical protein
LECARENAPVKPKASKHSDRVADGKASRVGKVHSLSQHCGCLRFCANRFNRADHQQFYSTAANAVYRSATAADAIHRGTTAANSGHGSHGRRHQGCSNHWR